MPAASPPPAQVFISYSHQDQEWLKRLNVHLAPVRRSHPVAIWDDTLLKPGMQWDAEIKRALASVRVVILLLSADFFNSQYIHNQELPAMLEAAADRGATILSIVISPCLLNFNEKLAAIQTVNSPSNPLVNMRPGKRDEVFVKVAQQVMDLLNQPAATLPASPVAEAPTPAARPGAAVPQPASPPTRATLEAQVQQQLEQLYDSLGDERFLVISAGEVYIQYYMDAKKAASKASVDKDIYVEAVANNGLPKDGKLSAGQMKQLVEAGFDKPNKDTSNYSLIWDLRSKRSLEELAIFTVAVLLDVYEVPEEAGIAFEQNWA